MEAGNRRRPALTYRRTSGGRSRRCGPRPQSHADAGTPETTPALSDLKWVRDCCSYPSDPCTTLTSAPVQGLGRDRNSRLEGATATSSRWLTGLANSKHLSVPDADANDGQTVSDIYAAPYRCANADCRVHSRRYCAAVAVSAPVRYQLSLLRSGVWWLVPGFRLVCLLHGCLGFVRSQQRCGFKTGEPPRGRSRH